MGELGTKQVVVRISGGLGNQLFQYALGRNLAQKLSVPLLLDTREYLTSRRPYALQELSLSPHHEISENGVGPLRHFGATNSMHRRLLAFLHPSVSFIQERRTDLFTFQPRVLQPPKRSCIYLDGYWHHERYFLPIREQLEREIRPRNGGTDFSALMRRINDSHSIGVHFRHGSDQMTKSIYGVPPLEYYYEALSRIGLRPDTRFFVFSDNIAWTRENFKPPANVTYVSGAYAVSDQEEFELLRSCKNVICANSTFSWWAAWLNGGKNGMLIAPSRWYADDLLDAKTKRGGLIPDSWTRI